jgi:hypothetical protein
MINMRFAKYLFLISAFGLSSTFLTNCTKEDSIPNIATSEATTITAISAVTGGSVTSDGGASITERGICWSFSTNPTTADSVLKSGSGAGSFSINMNNLSSKTIYHIRAYAKNKVGTAYGNDVMLTTLSAIPSTGLLGWWPFNGNAKDASGNGFDGTVFNATLANDRFGKPNSAYSYGGVSNYISLPPAPTTPNSQFTFSVWVKPTTIPQSGTGTNIFVTGYSNSSLDYGITFDNNYSSSGVTGFILGGYISPSGGEATTTGVVPAANSWYHIVTVRTNTTASVYLNGTLISTNAITGNPVFYQCTTCVSYLGIRTNMIQPFLGVIDDLAIYNRPLTADEVTKIYNSTGF